LGLLVEESRQNLLTYSDTLVTSWNHIGFTSNAVDSTYPNSTGNLGTKKLVEETGNASLQKVLFKDVTVGNNDQVFSHSIFVKPIGNRNAQINLHNVAPSDAKGFTVNFNLSSLTTFTTSVSASSSLDDYGVIPYPNGWYRIYVVGNTGSLNSNGTLLRFHLRILDSNGNSNYTGDGSSGLYAYGAQMELGPFQTSYIPTTASTVTRTADNVSMRGDNFSDWYNQSEGTVYADTRMVGVQTGRYDRLWAITNSNLNLEGISIFVAGPNASAGGSGYVSSITITNSATEQVSGTIVETALTTPQLKSAFAFKQNDCASSYNGQQRFVDSIVDLSTFTTPPDRLLIGQPQRFQGYSCMTVSQLTYYPRRLTNTQLQNLTR
jgi:hypothetical protein